MEEVKHLMLVLLMGTVTGATMIIIGVLVYKFIKWITKQ